MRIYLDWNIYKIYKSDTVSGFRDAIDGLKGKVLFPYSPAHIDDARKMLESEKGKSFFKSDLENLFALSGEYILNYDGKHVLLQLGHPLDYHDGTPDEREFMQEFSVSETFEEIGEIAEDYGITGFGKMVKKAFAVMSGFSSSDDVSDAYPNVPFFQSKNGWEIMTNMFPFVEQLTYNRDFYFDFSGAFREVELQVDANSGNWPYEEVVPNINELLVKMGGTMDFDSLVSLGTNKDEQKWFEKFYSAWLMLDWLGYKRDKLKKKNSTMKNIVNDLSHAYYGAHCAILVTEDANLRAKAKALYAHWGIGTRVLSPAEFLPYANQLINYHPVTEYNFLIQILQVIDERDIEYQISFRTQQYRAWKIEGRLLNHFNVVLESPSPLRDRKIILLKEDTTLSGAWFYEEAKMIANECVRLFGGDEIELNNHEQQIDDFVYGKLTGIRWEDPDVNISLTRSEHGIVLIFDFKGAAAGAENS
jgi:hypothetical protein